MKFCKDCKHYRELIVTSIIIQHELCQTPQNGLNPVDGSVKLRSPLISREYDSDSLCGPDARFFEEKDIVMKNPWYKFWK